MSQENPLWGAPRTHGELIMAFLGTAPFGSLLAGTLAARIGAPQTLIAGGLCCVRASLWCATRLPSFHEALAQVSREIEGGPVLSETVVAPLAE